MKQPIQLNCDLGESYGNWQMGNDAQVMPFIQQANIACGYHAGDPCHIQTALGLAKKYNVAVGAHTSYPDLMGFGRRSLQMAENEIVACMHYQIAALEGLAKCQGLELAHIKPHGALYNDMMAKAEVMRAVFLAVSSYHKALPLMLQATNDWQAHLELAAEFDIKLLFEAFIDRAYQADGRLVPRTSVNALLTKDAALAQAKRLVEEQKVLTDLGEQLQLPVDSLCVHGDGHDAADLAEAICGYLSVK